MEPSQTNVQNQILARSLASSSLISEINLPRNAVPIPLIPQISLPGDFSLDQPTLERFGDSDPLNPEDLIFTSRASIPTLNHNRSSILNLPSTQMTNARSSLMTIIENQPNAENASPRFQTA